MNDTERNNIMNRFDSYTRCAIDRLIDECERVRFVEAYTASHDDLHADRSMAAAAIFLIEDYILPNNSFGSSGWIKNLPEVEHQKRVKALRTVGISDTWAADYALRAEKNPNMDANRKLAIAAQFIVAEMARRTR